MSCLGPVLVSPALIPDPQKLHVRGLKNGEVLQDCGTEYVIETISLSALELGLLTTTSTTVT
jgi:hypothetical protein